MRESDLMHMLLVVVVQDFLYLFLVLLGRVGQEEDQKHVDPLYHFDLIDLILDQMLHLD